MDRAILQAHNDELNDYGVLIEMYREYREKRRKQHKRKLTEKELQLEFFYLYSEKIMKECKGIIDNYNYKVNIISTKRYDVKRFLSLEVIGRDGKKSITSYYDIYEEEVKPIVLDVKDDSTKEK